MNQFIETHLEQGIFSITFNRPDKKHALTHEMYSALVEAFSGVDANDNIRVVLLKGSAGIFTAGNDMGEFLNNPPSGLDSPVFRLLTTISQLQKPVIAAVSGLAIGIGTTILLHCDLIYCDKSARFQMPFVKLGLCPEAAASLLLPKMIGYANAAEILLTGQPFNSDRALSMGLVNSILDDEVSLITHATAQAALLVSLPAASLRMTKQLLKQSDKTQVQSTMRVEGEAFLKMLHAPEAKEALSAFSEKRAADFSKFK